MIVGAAFCPHPPLLVPQLAGGAAGELDGLRAACATALRRLASAAPAGLAVVGSGPRSGVHSPVARGSLSAFGAPVQVHLGSPDGDGAVELPLSLTIGAWLLAETLGPRTGAVGFSVGGDFAESPAADELLALAERQRLGLVVMGDGSVRRGERASSGADPRPGAFDGRVERALRDGDGQALADLDPSLGADLLAAGTPAWRAAGGILAGATFDADLLYAGDPYGVTYFVAAWTARG